MSAPTSPLLELRDISVIRGGQTALDHLNLTIRTGENVAILGPNGCGKSTLVKLIDRELYPKARQGVMRILGRERWDVSELRSTLGIVTNDLQTAIPPATLVTDAVIAGFNGKLALYYDEANDRALTVALEALKAADAAHLANRDFGALSSGEARRVLVARALAHRPATLLLDEPTTSLDIVSAHGLLKTLKSLAAAGTGVILVTHHLDEILPFIDRVVMLKEGRILHDGPREEVVTAENLTELFGMPIALHGHGPYSAKVENREVALR